MTASSTVKEAPTQRTAEAPQPLTRQDRCDRCGAEAYMRATRGEAVLLFCGHHTRRYEEQLVLQGFAIYSEMERLEREHGNGQKPGASA